MDKYLKSSTLHFITRFFSFKFLVLSGSILFVTNGFAQPTITGDFQNYVAFQLYEDYELVAGRNRLRTQFNQSLPFGAVYAEIDLIDRYSTNRDFEVLPRELYADWFTSNFDIRVGKQKIIWGQATGAFVNDILSPVDLREFLTQDVSGLRVGVNALNIQRYFGSNYLQMIVSPAIQPDKLPEPGSRWFPVQQPSTLFPVNFRPPDIQPTLSNLQAAIRFAWRPGSAFDADFILYHWAHPMPAFAIRSEFPTPTGFPEVTLRETYRTSPMAGFSLSWQASNRWIVTAEGLYVNERLFTYLPVSVNRLEEALEDPLLALQVLQEFEFRDDGFVLARPWYQQMAGFQTVINNVTVGLQGFVEVILNYEGRILPQRVFPYATAFAQQSFLRDRLNLFFTGRYNFYGEDFWTQLQGEYEIRDGFEFTLGTNLFGGPSISPFYGHLTFEQFNENSFIFAQTSVYF